MKPRTCPHARPNHGRHGSKSTGMFRGFLKRWFVANSLVSGFFALCWLLLRSGAKPSRLAYPCQQAAISAAMLAFAAPVVAVRRDAHLALSRTRLVLLEHLVVEDEAPRREDHTAVLRAELRHAP